MNKKIHNNRLGIIASLADLPNTKNDIVDFCKKIEGLPLREIEVELDSIERVEKYVLKNDILTTAMVNYPLGGCKAEYIIDSIQWVCEKKVDIICTCLPLFWLRSNEVEKIKDCIEDVLDACGEKELRISIESDLLTRKEISKVCDLMSDAGIYNLKSSCGFSHSTSIDVISYIRETHPNISLTVDNGQKGDSTEIDKLSELGVSNICIKEPWLYHF